MSDIYDQHKAAFKGISAYVILRDGKFVGNVSIKFPPGGGGRLWAYAHIYGGEMARGFAGGGGYDKRTAAVAGAFSKVNLATYVYRGKENEAAANCVREIVAALSGYEGSDWITQIERIQGAQYKICQAIL